MEGFGVERRPVEVEAAGKLGGEVLRVCRAATVTAKMDFAAAAKRFRNHLRCLLDAALKIEIVQNRLLGGDGLFNGLGDSWVHFLLKVKRLKG